MLLQFHNENSSFSQNSPFNTNLNKNVNVYNYYSGNVKNYFPHELIDSSKVKVQIKDKNISNFDINDIDETAEEDFESLIEQSKNNDDLEIELDNDDYTIFEVIPFYFNILET